MRSNLYTSSYPLPFKARAGVGFSNTSAESGLTSARESRAANVTLRPSSSWTVGNVPFCLQPTNMASINNTTTETRTSWCFMLQRYESLTVIPNLFLLFIIFYQLNLSFIIVHTYHIRTGITIRYYLSANTLYIISNLFCLHIYHQFLKKQDSYYDTIFLIPSRGGTTCFSTPSFLFLLVCR